MELKINTEKKTIEIVVDKKTSIQELSKNLEYTLKTNNLSDFKVKPIKTKKDESV